VLQWVLVAGSRHDFIILRKNLCSWVARYCGAGYAGWSDWVPEPDFKRFLLEGFLMFESDADLSARCGSILTTTPNELMVRINAQGFVCPRFIMDLANFARG
jgi:hypothetical protein